MLHPLALDLLEFLLPLVVGGAAFVCGRFLLRLLRTSPRSRIGLGISLVVLAGGLLTGLLRQKIGSATAWVSGTAVVYGMTAVFLIGMVWNAPGRKFSSGFLVALIALAASLILMQTSGPLLWRFGASGLWSRTADDQGVLRQSTGLTCSPAAAVMLLHHYGVAASEGEMAYLAGTSLFGTDASSIARAISEKVAARGWRAEAESLNYPDCILKEMPFIAHVDDPLVGGHALLVLRAAVEHTDVVDPLDGKHRTMSRAEFEQMWNGTVVHVIRPAE